MRNILFKVSFYLFLLLCCWSMLSVVSLGPLGPIQTYFDVSRAVAFWIDLAAIGLVGGCAYLTRPTKG